MIGKILFSTVSFMSLGNNLECETKGFGMAKLSCEIQ